jgi:male germ cell-associated kinase
MKPENLLEYNGTVKIADFGLTKVTKSKPPFTDYVSTRWYRAPEIILRYPRPPHPRSTKYGPAIDIFACGAIMGELYRNFPLFPGTSELDQMTKICKILGTPTKKDWPEGYSLARKMQYKFPKHRRTSVNEWKNKLCPTANDDAIDLILQMLRYNPSKVLPYH